MSVNLNYQEIIDTIKSIFHSKGQNTVKELLYSSNLKSFSQEVVIALIKLLISSDQLLVKNSTDKKFRDILLGWNPTDMSFELPSITPYKFEDVRICLSLPPFAIFGLTDSLDEKNIPLNLLLEEFTKLFLKANQSIKICSPFLEFNGFEYFKDTLLGKAQHKVDIQILSRQINTSENNTRFAHMKKIFELFRQTGCDNSLNIRNYYFQSKENKLISSIHAKMIIIDDIEAYVGSGEIRRNSFEKNLEVGLIMKGTKVKELAFVFDEIFARSEVIKFE